MGFLGFIVYTSALLSFGANAAYKAPAPPGDICPALFSKIIRASSNNNSYANLGIAETLQSKLNPARNRLTFVGLEDVTNNIFVTEKLLTDQGVKFHAVPNIKINGKEFEPYASRHFNIQFVSSAKRWLQLYRIDALPEIKGLDLPSTPALMHPDMPLYLEKLKSMGFEVVIDDSTQFYRVAGYEYDHEPFNIIGLNPNSNWSVFQHEFFHAMFAKYLRQYFETARLAKLENPSTLLLNILPENILCEFDVEILLKLEQLLGYGLRELAVNESLAVETERILSLRSNPPQAITLNLFRYGQKYQIKDFLDAAKSRPLNLLEAKSMLRSWIEFLVGEGNIVSEGPLARIFEQCYGRGNCGETAVQIARVYRQARKEGRIQDFRDAPEQYLQDLRNRPEGKRFQDIPRDFSEELPAAN